MIKAVLSMALALFLWLSAGVHLFYPIAFEGFIPDALPKLGVHLIAAGVEVTLAVLLFLPRTRWLG